MNGIRTRLSEALDEAEKRAQWLLGIAREVRRELKDPKLLGHLMPGWGAWPDVEAICQRELRLVERDRQLLDHYTRVVDSIEQADSTTGRTIRRVMAEVLESEIERLRAFWLGTQEGNDG